MLTRMTMLTRKRHFLLLIALWAWTAPGQAADNWLSEPERAFFSALGAEAKVSGKPVDRAPDLKALPEIARRARNPLKSRITAISQAFDRMKVSPDEKKEFDALMQAGQKEMQAQMRNVVIDALFGRNSFDSAVDATNGMMKKGGPVLKAWELQRKWLERGLAARLEADTNLKEITSELQRRTRTSRPASDISLRVMVVGKSLHLFGRAGSAGLDSPVVQVLMHKKSSQGAWTALNIASGLLVRGMGVEAMDLQAQGQGARLSAAQERAANLPYLSTLLLPSVPPGGSVDISLAVPAGAALGLERVALKVWTGEGTLSIDKLEGLEDAQAKAQAALQTQQAQRRSTRSRATGAFPFSQPPATEGKSTSPRKPLSRKQAVARARERARQQAQLRQRQLFSINLAKGAIARKDTNSARRYLQQAIDVDPKSPAAKQAQRMLKMLD